MVRWIAAAALTVVALVNSPASADVIVGQWCPPGGGRSVSVENYDNVSIDGTAVKANVNRHHVDFVIPAGVQDAGARFDADQISDEQIRVTIGSKSTEIWTPCKPIS